MKKIKILFLIFSSFFLYHAVQGQARFQRFSSRPINRPVGRPMVVYNYPIQTRVYYPSVIRTVVITQIISDTKVQCPCPIANGQRINTFPQDNNRQPALNTQHTQINNRQLPMDAQNTQITQNSEKVYTASNNNKRLTANSEIKKIQNNVGLDKNGVPIPGGWFTTFK